MKLQKFGYFVVATATLTATLGVQAYSAATKKPAAIKPVAATAYQSDEQQAIGAVRKAKTAVVSILGSVQNAADPNLGLDKNAGTGFLVDGEGYIISNRHVIDDGSLAYTVVFGEGQTYPARVVGLDKLNDIALLKIESRGLPTLKLGDSNSLETGQTVFAIGNSLGRYQNTVTRGVVSGLGRNVSVAPNGVSMPRYQNLIQTDASINPGNSGGPLINLNGEVIGMNTLIDTGGQGLGFAVPSSTIQDSINKMKASGGLVARPYLGVNFLTITKNLAAAKKLGSQTGALVTMVVGGAPASKAGVVAGDIVTHINNDVVTERQELDTIIQKYSPGTKVKLQIVREGATVTIEVTLGEYK
ncbi:MAG TPA: trypsin-like peptidase domain-containing protein [Patescibacteria group bacterium]|nr:trypsin-like peptidase domain-containing protein [Patescibacteria group bacterium]